jgi:soluble lytic murein transglycosylase-like protein
MILMRSRLPGPLAASLVAAMTFGAAHAANAEIVVFSTGRTLSVRGHRIDGQSVVLTLRSGGEIVCEESIISRIDPDEVPYPEAEPAETAEIFPTLSVPYGDIIDRAAAEQGIDPRYVKALIRVESAYQQRARSRKGAMGLMQLMPETARLYAVADPYEPRSNIEAGIKYLKMLLDRFESWPLALAAYNAGEAAVRRFGGVPPYPETREYVRSILRLIAH